MCNKKFYEELARKVLRAAVLLRDTDIGANRAANQVAASDEQAGLVRSLLLTRGNGGVNWARHILGDEADGILYPADDIVTLTLYTNMHPEQPVKFYAETLTLLLKGLRQWMDDHNGMRAIGDSPVSTVEPPMLCDGLTIFHNEDDRDTVDADVTVLSWDECYSGWELRVDHDVDNTIETWAQARDGFIMCVVRGGEFSGKPIGSWIDIDNAVYNVLGVSMAQVADSGT
jgi:hypothetical protein